MSDETWPAIKVERFYDEPLAHYEARRREIVSIVTGFRKSRYEGPAADRMEQRLMALQDGLVIPAVA